MSETHMELSAKDTRETLSETMETSYIPTQYTESIDQYSKSAEKEEEEEIIDQPMEEELFEYLDQEMEINFEKCKISNNENIEEQLRMGMIQDYIATRDYYNLKLILQTIPLPSIPKEHQDTYLIYLLRLAFEIQDVQIVRDVIEVWENNNPGQVKYPISTSLYLIKENPELVNILQFMDKALDLGYSYHIYKLVEYDSSPQISIAVGRLEKIYDSQPADLYRTIYDMCIDEYEKTQTCNTELLVIMEQKYREKSQVAATPNYMLYDDPFHFPFHDDLMKRITDMSHLEQENIEENIFQYITSQIELLPKEIFVNGPEDVRKQLEEKIHSIPNEEKLHQSMQFQIEREIFRTLGPSNPGIEGGVVEEVDSPCMKHGFHRMLVCYEHDNYDEDGEVINEDIINNQDWDSVEWFKGSCDNCMKIIFYKQRVARMPILEGGGWKGCYCSWECVIEDVIEDSESSILITLIKHYSNMCETNGIYERYWNKKYPEQLGHQHTLKDLEESRHLNLEPSEFDCCTNLLFSN